MDLTSKSDISTIDALLAMSATNPQDLAFFALLPAEIQLQIWKYHSINTLPDPSTFLAGFQVIVEHAGTTQTKVILPSMKELIYARTRSCLPADPFGTKDLAITRKPIFELLQTSRETRRRACATFILDIECSIEAENQSRWPAGSRIIFPQGQRNTGSKIDWPATDWITATEDRDIGARPCLLGIRNITLWDTIYTSTSLKLWTGTREVRFNDPPTNRGIWSLPSLEHVTIMWNRATPDPQELDVEAEKVQNVRETILQRLEKLNPEGRATPAVSLECEYLKDEDYTIMMTEQAALVDIIGFWRRSSRQRN